MVDEDSTEIQFMREPRRPSEAPCVVVLTGRKIGRVFRLEPDGTVLGRAADTDIVVEDDGVSRVHCIFALEDDRWMVRDMGSTNGTFVGDRTAGKTGVALKDGDKVRLGSDLILRFGRQDEIERQFLAQLYRAATRDDLTGLANRRHVSERLDSEIAWHRRHEEPLTLILLDIDHFKRLNDMYGHLLGDAVLQDVAEILQGVSREEDVVARWGGEEFLLVLRQTDAEAGRRVAERLRAAIAAHSFEMGDRSETVTASVGVVTRGGAQLRTADKLVAEADTLLYIAKEAGRNRVMPE